MCELESPLDVYLPMIAKRVARVAEPLPDAVAPAGSAAATPVNGVVPPSLTGCCAIQVIASSTLSIGPAAMAGSVGQQRTRPKITVAICKSSTMPATTIVEVPPERLHTLAPLWRALYDHHNSLAPHLHDRVVPFEQAWATRRELEREWLSEEPQSFALAAKDAEAPDAAEAYLGYAFVRVRSGEGFAVSWNTSRPLADLVTLVVAPAARGCGVGSLLLDAVEARLLELGVQDMTIAVITTNVDAARLYERRGAVPFLTQLVQRIEPGTSPAQPT